MPFHTQCSAKPTLGVWGLPPRKRAHKNTIWADDTLLFPEKEAKSVCSASQKAIPYPNLGEADPGGLGACPQEKEHTKALFGLMILFFFQKKKQKAFVLLRRRPFHTQRSAKPTLGVWGRAPSKTIVTKTRLSRPEGLQAVLTTEKVGDWVRDIT
jgi:hypothetical protein